MRDNLVKASAWASSHLALVYLAIALPVSLVLCFLTQPLHSLDEPAHFLRIVQLAHGQVMPVLGPDRHSTGSLQDTGVRRFAQFYGTKFDNYMHPERKTSMLELSRLRSLESDNRKGFIEHSNTTIYFPLAYAAPVAAVAVGSQLSNRPLYWFYEARIASALAGLFLTWGVLSVAGRGRLLFFVLSLLPICLFQMSALSADSILIPAALGLAVCFDRILDDAELPVAGVVLTLLAAALVGLGKIAYMPLAVVAPLVALAVHRRIDRTTLLLGAGSAVILAVWASWTLLVHDLVFTIPEWQSSMGGKIDVQKQLAFVIHHPLVFSKTLIKMLLHSNRYVTSFSGGVIGWLDTKLPRPIVLGNLAALVAAVFLSQKRRRTPRGGVAVIYIAALVSAFAIFFLLYLQWNPVGRHFIDGVQGRYFLPLLPVIAVCLPARALKGDKQALVELALISWGVLSAIITVFFVWQRYWA